MRFPGTSGFLRIPPEIANLSREIYNLEILKMNGILRSAIFLIFPGKVDC
jgi:hypothetical protein